ncbi:hypothetical protein BT93_L0784 [Corymbia citriodora subsp. variegata]|uniref:Uncharacterized protein n=1 Tax=Corymbia citriodora subsp. variegata TaxID=360336 RepID=A0A8T0CTK1_CORYI|nr:hypothetical protein BT93_L0784 [Corymbia citriodora subsp. variegata]
MIPYIAHKLLLVCLLAEKINSGSISVSFPRKLLSCILVICSSAGAAFLAANGTLAIETGNGPQCIMLLFQP